MIHAEQMVHKQTYDRSAQGALTVKHTSHASSRTCGTTSCAIQQALPDQDEQPWTCDSAAELPNEVPMSRSN